MKIGFILECTLGGPDAVIYPYVAKRLCDALEIEKPETLKDKKSLIQEAPLVAQTLLENGCDKVFIIWDRIPRWNIPGNCETDKEQIAEGLNNLEVPPVQVFLCCIDEMLESWLIADGDGITKWINSKTTHKIKAFPDHKTKQDQAAPKDRIKNYLRDNFNKWKYNDFEDNIDIIKSLSDYKKAAKLNPSFGEFVQLVNEICPD
jgi:hypothetical protein